MEHRDREKQQQAISLDSELSRDKRNESEAQRSQQTRERVTDTDQEVRETVQCEDCALSDVRAASCCAW